MTVFGKSNERHSDLLRFPVGKQSNGRKVLRNWTTSSVSARRRRVCGYARHGQDAVGLEVFDKEGELAPGNAEQIGEAAHFIFDV
jgi:hypothetical protein